MLYSCFCATAIQHFVFPRQHSNKLFTIVWISLCFPFQIKPNVEQLISNLFSDTPKRVEVSSKYSQ